ncbi:hypothetical protein DLD77_05525 [Chitinophaga alhagiae]|uniref:Gliding motility protein RemB n=1 Tax=Chitinophaga alhagiae TaxID=2203219 RepID=A0ABN5LP57_9BACT|nr:hypothetical protein [Chitinophaga alhagiae]AWO01188.1 hypothetical protein DLD77_05525 [Chitinophaga alhagiae]
MQLQKKLNSLLICLLFTMFDGMAQNAGSQFSIGFYRSQIDSGNYHSSIRDYIQQRQFVLPSDSVPKARSWVHRKLFQEHLLEYDHPDYNFYFSLLPDLQLGNSSARNTIWLNTRGAIAGGRLGKNFEFRAEFYENQGKYPRYLDEFTRREQIIPGQGEVKFDSSGASFDFAYTSALLSFTPSKYLNVQLGYDRNFIGDGYRSMLLSDNSFNYPFLKLTAGIGNVKYMVMWAQFMDMKEPKLSFLNGYRKKWGVFHYLDWNITNKFSLGLFEAVIWNDADTAGKRGFDFSYLIPLALLRPVEFSVGSPDNALMGVNAKYDLSTNSTIYGQFILDEFKLKEVTSGKGWWGNKFGGQLGFRSNNLFRVPALNLLTEVNAARPFTYAQRNSLLAYTHYNQALAHPLGANFIEWMNLADYQYKRWYFRGEVQLARYGLDSGMTNYGKDIFASYHTRTKEYGNKIGQGITTDLMYLRGSIAFLLNPKNNLRLEVSVAGRQEKNDLFNHRELIFQVGLRSTFRRFNYDF